MTDLFSHERDSKHNLLPVDGVVHYFGPILAGQDAKYFLNTLMQEVIWKQDEAIVFGKHIITTRKTAWYGDEEYSYTYSGITRKAAAWIPSLLALKKLIEEKSSETFNSCLLNLYHHGNEGMGWHSDDEKMLKPNGTIASMSLGAERIFKFKHKRKDLKSSLLLENGGLLLMKDNTQKNWLHSLPKSTKISQPRINLTFRNIVTI